MIEFIESDRNEILNLISFEISKIITEFRKDHENRLRIMHDLRMIKDARTNMFSEISKNAMYVQRFDDSLNSAIHITYRISLRSLSISKLKDSLLKVLSIARSFQISFEKHIETFWQAFIEREWQLFIR